MPKNHYTPQLKYRKDVDRQVYHNKLGPATTHVTQVGASKYNHRSFVYLVEDNGSLQDLIVQGAANQQVLLADRRTSGPE